ncbi:lateral signaling target protein 2 homolog [Alosa alosa]|uniref:lateral signaling target protein 2 homolog n=1 Tax=Alosa alosa TaxID=278164 RepID=UPI0020151391|nr:lateral signaling target protein 2 homolog [Alosa alosa]
MLIQWIEDPPTWDVLPQNKVVNGLCEVGYICDVQYRDETSPAKIIQKGSRTKLMKALEALERGCRNAATGTEERGRGLREKRPPAQFSPASSEEDEEDTNPKLKGKKNLTKALSLQFLNEFEESEPGYSRDVIKLLSQRHPHYQDHHPYYHHHHRHHHPQEQHHQHHHPHPHQSRFT